MSQHIDSSKNTKAGAALQHTDTSKSTKAGAASQHTDTSKSTRLDVLLLPVDDSGQIHRIIIWFCLRLPCHVLIETLRIAFVVE